MGEVSITDVAAAYRKTHQWTLELVDDLSDEQFTRLTAPTVPLIAFHLWHMGRYADSLSNEIGQPGGRIWEDEQLRAKWGFEEGALGIYDSGTGMEEQVSVSLDWPAKTIVVDYVRRAFDTAEHAVSTLDAKRLDQPPKWGAHTVAAELVAGLVHHSRHLGMIEALRGVMGLKGLGTF